MSKKLILWDIDGTLMSCYRDGTLAINETFRRRTGQENACGSVIAGTSMDHTLFGMIMDKYGIDRSEREKIINEYADILTDIVSRDSKKKVLPGVIEILETLGKRDDVIMGIITSNLKVGADIKLSSVGLEKYFSFGGYGDFPGEKWEAAKLAVEEAEKLAGEKLSGDRIFVVGDTAYDIECAKKINAVSVAVATGWMDEGALAELKPDHLLESLEDTQNFIGLLDR